MRRIAPPTGVSTCTPSHLAASEQGRLGLGLSHSARVHAIRLRRRSIEEAGASQSSNENQLAETGADKRLRSGQPAVLSPRKSRTGRKNMTWQPSRTLEDPREQPRDGREQADLWGAAIRGRVRVRVMAGSQDTDCGDINLSKVITFWDSCFQQSLASGPGETGQQPPSAPAPMCALSLQKHPSQKMLFPAQGLEKSLIPVILPV